jgi:SpoVK/Ycf46/Vps4 family AAA+-type ATPase
MSLGKDELKVSEDLSSTDKQHNESKEVESYKLDMDLVFEKLETHEIKQTFQYLFEIENVLEGYKPKITAIFNTVLDLLTQLLSEGKINSIDMKTFEEHARLKTLHNTYKERKDLPTSFRDSIRKCLENIDSYDADLFLSSLWKADQEFTVFAKYLMKFLKNVSSKNIDKSHKAFIYIQKVNKDLLKNEDEKTLLMHNLIKNVYFNKKLKIESQQKLIESIKKSNEVPLKKYPKNILQALINNDSELFFNSVNDYIQYTLKKEISKLDISDKFNLFFNTVHFYNYQNFWNKSLVELILSHKNNNIFVKFMHTYQIPFNIPFYVKNGENEQYVSLLEYTLNENPALLAEIKNEEDLYKSFNYEIKTNDVIKKISSDPLKDVYLSERKLILLIENKSPFIKDLTFKELLEKGYSLAFVKLYKHRKELTPEVKILKDESPILPIYYLGGLFPGESINSEIIDIFVDENFEIINADRNSLRDNYKKLSANFKNDDLNNYLVQLTQNLVPLIQPEFKKSLLDKDSKGINIDISKEEFSIQWFDPNQVLKSVQNGSGAKSKILKDILEKQPVKKPLVRVEDEEFFSILERDMPNFKEVSDYYKGQFRQNYYSNKSRITPILLLGEPGIGKTHFAKKLAAYLKTGYTFIDMGSITSGFVLSGINGSYQDAKQGKILDAMMDSPTFNPIILMDEVDKVNTGNYDPLAPLYQLLEEVNAKEFTDEFTEVPFNASGIIYIACANNLNNLPKPILSRFKVFEVPSPTNEQLDIIIKNIYSTAIENNPLISQELPEEVIKNLKSNSLREVKVIIDDAISALMLSQSREEIDRMQKDGKKLTLDVKYLKEKKQKSKLGF